MSTRTHRPITAKRAQRGAALVVGMLLLLVLTLLAISGMNTASLELAMAGNMQHHENAFRAAETGVEQAMLMGMWDPDNAPQRLPATAGATTPIGATGDHFFATITPQLGGLKQPALWGSSMNDFSTFHFEIQSTGGSARNALAIATQGVAKLAQYDESVAPLPGMPTTLTP